MLNDKPRSVAVVRKAMHAAVDRYADIGKLIAKAEESIILLRDEQRSLKGWSGGEIVSLENQLKRAEQVESDKLLIRVKWIGINSDAVIYKVTKQRIFVRNFGAVPGDFGTRVVQFYLDGQPAREYESSKIDIRKTFGIDADEVPPNFKCSKQD